MSRDAAAASCSRCCTALTELEPDRHFVRTFATMTRSDEELAQRLSDPEDDAALVALYRTHAGALYGFGLSRLGDRGLAEDFVQEVFTRVWRKADGFDPRRGNFRTWMFAIARNTAIDIERRRAVRPQTAPGAEVDQLVSPEEPIEQALLRWQIRSALSRLSPEHREVIRLTKFEALTLEEVSTRVGVPLGTVKSRLSYALRNLRLALEEAGVFE
jgi:RNA polymerase sigma-70 factor (ECF subfamily)